ncbi:MAG: alpha-glucosidase C-terminal domain-containing protein, partial [Cytophagales bacterium]
IRKQNPVLSVGKFEPLETEDERLFAFWRTLNEERIVVLLNFSTQTANFSVPTSAKKVIGNYPLSKLNELMPWEAAIYRCE